MCQDTAIADWLIQYSIASSFIWKSRLGISKQPLTVQNLKTSSLDFRKSRAPDTEKFSLWSNARNSEQCRTGLSLDGSESGRFWSLWLVGNRMRHIGRVKSRKTGKTKPVYIYINISKEKWVYGTPKSCNYNFRYFSVRKNFLEIKVK